MKKKIATFNNGMSTEELELYPRISEIEECVKETVIGQDELVKSIATSIYDSMFMGIRCVELIIGKTGTGKTLTMESFCKELGLAYTIENATQYTQEGYEGQSVDMMLSNLVRNAGNDFQRAENGVLIIDEIGKKTSKGRGNTNSSDVSGEAVIDSLLPILSGATINIEVQYRIIPFDTKNLKIFLMDACAGLEEIRNERIGKKTIGFYKQESNKPKESSEGAIYTKDDLIKYGFTPEFVGRLNGIHVTNDIGIKTLVKIQKECKTNILQKYKKGIEERGIQLILYPKFYDEIAERALGYNTGARELENVIKQAFKEIMHEIYDTERKIKSIKIRQGITEDNKKYKINYE